MGNQTIALSDIDALVFDFDGVLTDNRLLVGQDGTEWVSCNRSDGLAFDVLRKIGMKLFILSTEHNPVVAARGAKLKVPVVQGVKNKLQGLKELINREGLSFQRLLYIGNDLNDYQVMARCGFTACPSDSHPRIKERAKIVLESEGGAGVARELVEDIFDLDIVEILYSE